MENVLLHSCCAPCSAAIVEWMLAQDAQAMQELNAAYAALEEEDK